MEEAAAEGVRRRKPADDDGEGPAAGHGETPPSSRTSSTMTRSYSNSSSANGQSGASTPQLGRGGLSFTGGDGASIFTSREDVFGGGLPLYDALVSLDAHLDLIGRRMRPYTEEWLAKARQTRDGLDTRLEKVKGMVKMDKFGAGRKKPREPRERKDRDLFISEAEREFREFREKVKLRVKNVQDRWNDSKTVSLRDKISFFCAVNNVLGTALLLAFWPQYMPLAYSLQAVYYLPLRIYSYKRLAWHYFLFDMCYYVNFLTLLYLWAFPSSTLLFEACYGLSLGPLASAIATWRNSLVFHSLEKCTSLFIHIYPPLVMTVLRHFHPNAAASYPAVGKLPELGFWRHLLICSVFYLAWQGAYLQFVIVGRASKIASGGRVTSFTWLLNSKKGVISNILHRIRPERRASSFIAAQYVYTLVTIIPAYFAYRSKVWSGIYLWAMFGVSVWNGASWYIELYGKRFEKEFNKLKQELDELNRAVADRTAPGASTGTAQTTGGAVPDSASASGAVTPTESYDGQDDPVAADDDGDVAAGSGKGVVTPTSSRPLSPEPNAGGFGPATRFGGDAREATPRPAPTSSSSKASSEADDELPIASEEAPAVMAKAVAESASPTAATGGDAGSSGSEEGGSLAGGPGSGSDRESSWIDVRQQQIGQREAS